jgi:hypothetical protein
MLILDSVSFHKSDAVRTSVRSMHTLLSNIYPGLIGLTQPLDVGINNIIKKGLITGLRIEINN